MRYTHNFGKMCFPPHTEVEELFYRFAVEDKFAHAASPANYLYVVNVDAIRAYWMRNAQISYMNTRAFAIWCVMTCLKIVKNIKIFIFFTPRVDTAWA